MTQCITQSAELSISAFPSFLSGKEVADLLLMTVDWVRAHASEIPGLERLGSYYRFRSTAVQQWLGGSDRLLEAERVAALLRVPKSWVYANADQIPGVLRLGRYVRFRPNIVRHFLTGSGVVQ